MITWIPIVVFAIIVIIFQKGVVRELGVVLVDQDRSQISRAIAFEINSNPTLNIVKTVNSMQKAKELIVQNRASAIIYIPAHFEKNIMIKKVPKIDLFVNTQFILIGGNIESELQKTLLPLMIKADVMAKMVKVKNLDLAIAQENPIQIQQNSFFNSYANYSLFLVSALIPAIWQVFVMISTVIAFGSMFESKKEYEWYKNSNNNLFFALLGKLLPYTLIMFTLGFGFLSYFYFYVGWGFEGSFAFMLLTLLVTTLVYQAIALLLFSITFEYVLTLSACGFYAAPAFAYLGITYPVSNMNEFATFWHNLLPISHYMQIQLEQASYGTPLINSLPTLGVLSLFLFAFIPAYFKFYLYFKKSV
ncbi:MAG: ABC transporter permease [Helicobacteraceae bacterium]|nr:ABC transporter permease [Helicobacteraceae bacterium]